MSHLFDQIRAHAPEGSAPFLDAMDGRRFAYDDLFTQSARFAATLRSWGVEPGDRVAVQVEKSPEALFLYVACLRAGAVLVPLNTAYTLNELKYFFEDAEPKVVVCSAGREGAIAGVAGDAPVKTIDELARSAFGEGSFVDSERGPDDLAAILYTSGTTGRSKGAMLSHENLASNARSLIDLWRFSRRDVLIHALPIFHTHGLFVAVNVTLLAGCSMLFYPRFDAAQVVTAMRRATVLMGVPTFYVRLLDTPRLAEAARHMRLFISGSAPLLPETFNAWREMTNHTILERYGMTETNMNTSNPYDGDRVAGTVGFPLPEVALRITDPETGCPLPESQIGMIEVKGPNVFKGYWRMPAKTASEFRADGFFITGDLGLIDSRGYVQIVGRSKDLVISGGYNIYPREVETEIDQIDGVAESAVIGVPHPDLGEGLTAVVVRSPGSALDETNVITALSGRLARYKQPRRVVFVSELQRNTMGKVEKSALRARYRDLYQSEG